MKKLVFQICDPDLYFYKMSLTLFIQTSILIVMELIFLLKGFIVLLHKCSLYITVSKEIPVKKLAFQIHDRDKCQIYISRTHVAAGNLFFLTPKCWWNDSTGVPWLDHSSTF